MVNRDGSSETRRLESGAAVWGHRLAGISLAAAGIALASGELLLLYGDALQQAFMVGIGLPRATLLSAAGAVCFVAGCVWAAAPRTTAHHARRVTKALARRATKGPGSPAER